MPIMLIRHGEAESYVDPEIGSWHDPRLAEKGREQVAALRAQRFMSRNLAEELMVLGEAEMLKRYRRKLLEAVYQQIDFPEKLK